MAKNYSAEYEKYSFSGQADCQGANLCESHGARSFVLKKCDQAQARTRNVSRSA